MTSKSMGTCLVTCCMPDMALWPIRADTAVELRFLLSVRHRGCPLGTGQDGGAWHASGTTGEDKVSHQRTVGATELAGRLGPASALSNLVDHQGEPDANHPGVLG